MTDNTQTTNSEIDTLRNRLDWLDEERRKTNRHSAELEQRMEMQAKAIEARDARIRTLEEQLGATRNRLKTLQDVDVQFEQLKKELVGLIDKNTDRIRNGSSEDTRLRNQEREITNRELSEIRKELPKIGRIETEVEARKSEEQRLQQLIANVQTVFPQYDSRIDALGSSNTYLEEVAKQLQRQVSQLEATHIETGQRIETNKDQMSTFNLQIGRIEAAMQESARTNVDVERQVREWLEQARTADFDRTQRVASWQNEFESYKGEMQKFHQQFMQMNDQSRESRATLQSLEMWRKQLERTQRESAELNRVEGQRLNQQWENFRAQNEKFWSQIEADAGQRTSAQDRRWRELAEQHQLLAEKFDTLQQEKDTLYRIQTAQSDALKQFPTLWLDEVEKAIANDPNRRRSAASAPLPDEY